MPLLAWDQTQGDEIPRLKMNPMPSSYIMAPLDFKFWIYVEHHFSPQIPIQFGFPVHHQIPEFTQAHVHWVGDAIQPSHLLLSPSPLIQFILQFKLLTSAIWNFSHYSMSEWVSEVAQSCPTLCDPRDCSPPGSSLHGILQARVLEWVAISFSTHYI